MSNINPGGVIANKEKFTILDVRSPEEYKNFNIKGSIHIPLEVLEKNISKIPKNKPIVCLCRSGNRSETATYLLNLNGFEARNLSGGILSWVKTELEKGNISETEYKDRIKKINFY